MQFHIAAIYIALTIPFGNIDPITLDFGIYPAIGLPVDATYVSGMATPLGYWYSTQWHPVNIHEEELLHIEQMEALGIYFLPAYLIDSRLFEPYEKSGVLGTTTKRDSTLHNMWRPPREIQRQFPQFRVTFNPGNTDVQFLPGYRLP